MGARWLLLCYTYDESDCSERDHARIAADAVAAVANCGPVGTVRAVVSADPFPPTGIIR